MKETVISKGQELYAKARQIIPGGTQLLSKRPERFLPNQWPSYYTKAQGCRIWDLDGNEWTDMSMMGVGACVLGYADPDVDHAVIGAIQKGSMSTLNCPEEVELAELLCKLHPWAEMARFSRGGGEAMAISARIARAATGREKIAFCGYHGWHDWYMAANLADEKALDGHLLPGLEPAGVPRGLTGTLLPFHYNDLKELQSIMEAQKGQIAAIVMEPSRSEGPQPGFLEEVRRLATQNGTVLIFDEVTSGWRMATGGIHLRYGVNPDIAVFAKATGNGYPIGAVIGRRAVMQAAQTSFISSTSWTERIGPTAALATLQKFQRLDVSSRLIKLGERVQAGWKAHAAQHALKIHVSGIAPLSHLSFSYDSAPAISTLFTQEMLDQGFLAGSQYYASYAHSDEDITRYLEAIDKTFARLAQAIQDNRVEALLRGPIQQQGFKRLT
jgi:glutamate-1-semialdehyde 2,1-aminomutase